MERSSPRKHEASAADKSAWKSLTSRAAAAFEEDRLQRLAAARDRRHRAASASVQTTDYRLTPVVICVLPALDCDVTRALNAESTGFVIVGHRWTTNNRRFGVPKLQWPSPADAHRNLRRTGGDIASCLTHRTEGSSTATNAEEVLDFIVINIYISGCGLVF